MTTGYAEVAPTQTTTLLRGGRVAKNEYVNERGCRMHTLTCGKCGGDFEARASLRGRQVNCDACKEPTLGATPSGFGFIAREFVPHIEAVIARADARLRHENHITDERVDSGAVEWLAADVAGRTGMTHEAAVRRLYGYRTLERRMVDTEFADAVLLADGQMIGDLEDEGIVKVYPTTKRSALEMVTIAAEDAGELVSVDELKRRAERLYDDTLKAVFGERDSDRAAA